MELLIPLLGYYHMVQVLLNYNKKYSPNIGTYLKKMEYRIEDVVILPEEEKELIRKEEPTVIRNIMKEKIRKVDGLIYLAGDDPPDDKLLEYEIDAAKENNIPVVSVKIPDTKGVLPPILQDNGTVRMHTMNVKMELWDQMKPFYQ